jgi:hypothetical protein
VAGQQVLVNTGITHLVAAEALAGDFVAPNTDLRAEQVVDSLDDIIIFDNHF